METKLIAAEIATAAGVATIISNSAHPERIFEIIQYNTALRSRSSSAPSTPHETLSGRVSPAPETAGSVESTASSLSENPNPRPLHTMFTPSQIPLRDLKTWTSHTLAPSGNVIVDAGAHLVLSRRDSGGRLLPAGVLGVKGTFASGQAVRISIRKRRPGAPQVYEPDVTTALAKATLASYADGSPLITQPGTPNLLPAASATSSIISLDDLARANSTDSTNSDATVQANTHSPQDEEHHEKEEETDDGWDLIEVGRGLANYNSAQINRVKGMKR